MKAFLTVIIVFFSQFSFCQEDIKEFISFNCDAISKAGDINFALNAGMTKKINLLCSPKG
jgi:hypothetical protein